MKPGALLTFYRVMAYVTAVLLIVLCVAWGMELGSPRGSSAHEFGTTWSGIVGVAHGWLYMLYLVVAFFLTRKLRIDVVPMLLVLLAGTIPFGAFVAERKVVRWFHEWESGAPDAATENTGSASS